MSLDEKEVVARDGIEPPTPAFSGPRSTTELSGLGMKRRIGTAKTSPSATTGSDQDELPANLTGKVNVSHNT